MIHLQLLILLLLTWSPFSLAETFCGEAASVDPISSFDSGLTQAFCAYWNPDFCFKEQNCCARAPASYRKRGIRCTPERSSKSSYCDEMTEEQRETVLQLMVTADRESSSTDALEMIDAALGRNDRPQAFCGYQDGFLAWGRPVVPSEKNRISIARMDRCTNFGTDRMAGLLEWVGRQVSERFPVSQFPELKMLLGDISAPRGGCLFGRGGRRGHGSHTSGRDADVGFLSVKRSEYMAPTRFHTYFEPETNWWLLKQIFNNPYACVKVVFSDRHLINRLRKIARNDPDWEKIGPYIKHYKKHQNHFHVRVGDSAGPPGCLESEDLQETLDELSEEQTD